MIINKPWGHENRWAVNDKYLGKILFIKRGQKLSRQYHEVKDETVFVLSGILLVEIGQGDELFTHVLREGEAMRIKPNTIHRFIAPPDGFVKLIEVSTPEINDVVRLEDNYGRS